MLLWVVLFGSVAVIHLAARKANLPQAQLQENLQERISNTLVGQFIHSFPLPGAKTYVELPLIVSTLISNQVSS